MDDKDLKRIQREKREQAQTFTTIVVVLSVMVLALVGVLLYVNWQRNNIIDELKFEKTELTKQMIELRGEYDNLTSSYEHINLQLDSSKEQVNQLIDRLNRTEATNRAQIRKYEQEMRTLRSIMRHYVVQIDSLNTLNKQLTAQTAEARKETAKVKKQNEQMSKEIKSLTKKVATGSVVKARSISVVAQNKAGKTLNNPSSKLTDLLLTSMTLVENDLAERGWKTIYLKVFGPDDTMIVVDDMIVFDCAGEQKYATVSREVDYQGKEVELSIYFHNDKFLKGSYRVEVYSNDGYLGDADIVLR